jgi:hypothetical protein
MNAPTSPAVSENLPDMKVEINNLVEQKSTKLHTQTENGSERIRSSLARLASSSVNELEGLTSELQQLQEFLKCEVGRVQSEIESVLAGVSIIIETISPWKSNAELLAPPPKSAPAVPANELPPGPRQP